MKEQSPRKIQQVVREFEFTAYLHYRELLKALYAVCKSSFSSYSYLKFSEDLGFGNNSTMRHIINNQRPLTIKAGQRIADALGLSSQRKKYWLALILFSNAEDPGDRDAAFEEMMAIKGKGSEDPLAEHKLEFFGEWQNSVIYELAGRPDFQFDPKWIQQKLLFPIRLEKIKRSLEILSSLGLIYYDGKLGRFTNSAQIIDTGPDARGMAYIGYQQEMIEMGKKSIVHVRKDRRELIGTTFCLRHAAFKQLCKKLRKLVEETVHKEQQAVKKNQKQTSVMQLNIQLFPHTVD